MAYTQLLSPIRIGGITVPNRIVMPPLVIWKAGLDGLVNEAHLQHYTQSAGPGLCIVEAAAVSPEGRLAATQLGVWSEDHVEGLGRLAAIIHQAGAVAGIQIHHAGGRTNPQKNGGLPILVPSREAAVEARAVELTAAEIERIIADFGRAAERCIAAGFDLIEIHGAHGFLPSQFLSPEKNRRNDQWGGSINNRVRFLVECVRAVQQASRKAARTVLVTARLGVADGGSPPLTVEDGCAAAALLAASGVDLLDISHAGSLPSDDPPRRWSQTLELARETRKHVTVPVIGVGEIKTPAEAEAALADGVADMIAVGRALLADPEWAAKSVAGKAERIYRCIDCKPRCFHHSEPEKCPPRRTAAAANSPE